MKIFLIVFILLQGIGASSQSVKPSKKNTLHKDTARKPAPAIISLTGNCLNGVSEVVLTIDTADSLATPQWVYAYLIPVGADVASISPDSSNLYGVISYTDIVKNKHRIILGAQGMLYVKTAVKGPVFSAQSNTVAVSLCSSIDFPPLFDKGQKSFYAPENLMNVQVLEFDIYDRVGNPVYSIKSNEIRWDGTYPDKRSAASGVYYYNCVYLDLTTANHQKKTAAGMIELKN